MLGKGRRGEALHEVHASKALPGHEIPPYYALVRGREPFVARSVFCYQQLIEQLRGTNLQVRLFLSSAYNGYFGQNWLESRCGWNYARLPKP